MDKRVLELLVQTCQSWGISLAEPQVQQLTTLVHELQRWNERLNLTAITNERDIVIRHVLDSLRCAVSWGRNPQTVADLGTGAGFPGLPLRIVFPDIQLLLVESIAKKTDFLHFICAELGLNHVTISTERAETIGHDPLHREQYAVVVARAVAELRVLAEYCLPLCQVGGRFLAPKGSHIQDEIVAAQNAIQTMGGSLREIESVFLPELEPRTLVVIDKILPCSPRYPRAIGIPSRRPI
jgi:16S rRNA (guanine527-N7)-methyltransferase